MIVKIDIVDKQCCNDVFISVFFFRVSAFSVVSLDELIQCFVLHVEKPFFANPS